MTFSYSMLACSLICTFIGAATEEIAMSIWSIMFMAMASMYPVIKYS